MARQDETVRQQKKSKIIEAAVEVFAEKGFYNANVRDVARRAGVADGTIYVYFKGKDDLLISLFEQKMENILIDFNHKLEKITDPLHRLQEFVRTYFEMIKNDIHLAEVFQVELRQSSKFLKDYHNQKFLDFLNIIATILKDGIDIGFFRENINIDVAKIMIFGAIDEVARQWILGADDKYSLPEASEQVSYTLIHGFIRA
ncbi:MAG TPA: TetR/AcrR family transcriptional regulator [Caldithrix abyssi]|uniref:TetR/AcrR family transcriptional regulator n=1 Tax=Caldithrix abyssi TaxID=187145 RepID=A0A7V5UFZ4_CALAY|nr:TetR/AcrR family transcriptional regulator [Caldithrix abyssi]